MWVLRGALVFAAAFGALAPATALRPATVAADAVEPESIYLVYVRATPFGFVPRHAHGPAFPHAVLLQNHTGLGGIYFTVTRARAGRYSVVHSEPVSLGATQSFIVFGRHEDRFYFRSAFVPGRFTFTVDPSPEAVTAPD